jgi:hypothetical protein
VPVRTGTQTKIKLQLIIKLKKTKDTKKVRFLASEHYTANRLMHLVNEMQLALKISIFLHTELVTEIRLMEGLTFAYTDYSAFNLLGVRIQVLTVLKQRERLKYFQNCCKGAGHPGTFAWTNVLAVGRR